MKFGDVYEHYKGNRYLFLSLGKHSETLEVMVMYAAMYGDREIWLRPKEMFFGTVEINGETIPRFKKLYNINEI